MKNANHPATQKLHPKLKPLVAGIALASSSLLLAPAAQALQFDLSDEVSGRLDTTLGYGVIYRTEKPDLIDSQSEITYDNKGIVSQAFRVGADLELKYRNYGMVLRGISFYDTEIMNEGTNRAGTIYDDGIGNNWTKDAEDNVGFRKEILDAYVYGSFSNEDLLGFDYVPIDVRLGQQFINWGEGLFFIGGLNTANPFNINAFNLPGAEIKEAFVPMPAAYVQAGLGDNLALSAYYQFKWEEHEFPPVGTYFGDDFLGPGGVGHDWVAPGSGFLRTADRKADDNGQYGISAQYTVGDWELGAYFLNYHSKFPFLRLNPESGFADWSLVYPEDIEAYGLSFATQVGGIAVAGELAYRPNDPVLNGLFADTSGKGDFDRRETLHASVNTIIMTGAGFSFDDHMLLAQVGMDFVDGDLNSIPDISLTETADRTAWGVALDWEGTWRNVAAGWDLSPGFFIQHGVKGNSHFWGNFQEDHWLGSARLNATYLEALQVGLTYATAKDSDNDTLSLNVNYKF